MPTIHRLEPKSLAYAAIHHVNAQTHARAAIEVRSLARFYQGPNHGLPAEAAAGKVADLIRSASGHDRREGEALRRLNYTLRDGGAGPGEEVEVLGHAYRAANDGGPAVYLGAPIPAHEPGLAPGPQDERSDREEDAALFAEMARYPA